MDLEDKFGLFCNYSGDGYVRRGSLACVSVTNGAGRGWEFVVRSRGGRMIKRYLRLDRCSSWRVKFVAPRFRRAAFIYGDRAAAQDLADRWVPALVEEVIEREASSKR